jgi:hypothetical protein
MEPRVVLGKAQSTVADGSGGRGPEASGSAPGRLPTQHASRHRFESHVALLTAQPLALLQSGKLAARTLKASSPQ